MSKSPDGDSATHDGSINCEPLPMTCGLPSINAAISELVVPRSIPTIISAIVLLHFRRSVSPAFHAFITSRGRSSGLALRSILSFRGAGLPPGVATRKTPPRRAAPRIPIQISRVSAHFHLCRHQRLAVKQVAAFVNFKHGAIRDSRRWLNFDDGHEFRIEHFPFGRDSLDAPLRERGIEPRQRQPISFLDRLGRIEQRPRLLGASKKALAPSGKGLSAKRFDAGFE